MSLKGYAERYFTFRQLVLWMTVCYGDRNAKLLLKYKKNK